jgi:sarcosine oxidase subunit beta
MTPDFGPIIGPTPVDGFFVDVGWGTYGFKAGPVAGETVAEMIANDGRPGPLIESFGLGRFESGTLTAEKGAAAVGH